MGKGVRQKTGIQRFALQHHYCHIASLMAEYGLDELFGIAFDGTGYGIDGNIWGSEFLYCDIKNFQRLELFDVGKFLVNPCFNPLNYLVPLPVLPLHPSTAIHLSLCYLVQNEIFLYIGF